MDTTAISGANPGLGFLPNAPAGTSRPSIPASGEPAAGIKLEKPASPVQTDSGGRALEVFRKELMYSGAASAAPKPTYPGCDCTDYKPVLTTDDVAAVALDGAKRTVAGNADVSSYALLRFRQRVQTAATITQQSVGTDRDFGKVEAAVGKIESGLDSLDSEASRNVESSASVLAIDSRQRQRSTIRIRTQEGDVVRLDIKSASRLSARDIAVSDESGSTTRTEVATSSRSRLSLNVRGDLNEAEYAAIQAVFAQAESIAGEFFDGDLGAAFSLASGLEFDAGQLAKVNLRFRSSEVTNTAFAQTVRRAATPAISVQPDAPQPDSPQSDSSAVATAAPKDVVNTPSVTAAAVIPATVEPETPVVAPAAEPGPADASTSSAATPGIDLGSDTFLRFFDLLGDFLRGVADGFERATSGSGEAGKADSSSFKFHFSQSFKLQIFKSVLQVAAPDGASEDASSLAAALIDGLPDAQLTEKAGEKDA